MPETDFEEKMILVRRTAKTYQGGRRFRFGALVVVGDRQGRVGLGLGKAKEVPLAVQKAGYYARRNMVEVPIQNGTIPHEIEVEFGASKILLKPARPPVRGVIAGAVPRAILELAGITDILTKELGSRNPINIAYATMEALRQLQTKEDVKRLRRLRRSDGQLKVKLVKSPIG
jgi:small subunit ribosomal protein S5